MSQKLIKMSLLSVLALTLSSCFDKKEEAAPPAAAPADAPATETPAAPADTTAAPSTEAPAAGGATGN